MRMLRPFLPLLLAPLAIPAMASDISNCANATDSVRCLIDEAEFTLARNAEIDASMARVAAQRARELALSVTHCKTDSSRAPRCLAERDNILAARQNALADASMARVVKLRTTTAAARKVAAATERRQFETAQNKYIDASIAAAEAERARRLFVAHQNVLARASLDRVAEERRRQIAARNAPCKFDDTRSKCIAERELHAATYQNRLAAESMQRVKAERERAFAAARNAEAARSMAAVERLRASQWAAMTSHCARVGESPRCSAERIRELALSVTHCKTANDMSPRCVAERVRAFAAERNAEIERSLAAVAHTRAMQYAAATSHCFRSDASPRCEAERAREIAAVVHACRTAGYSSSGCNFSNINRSEVAAATTHCKGSSVTPRCAAELDNDFAKARNAEATRSMAAVARERAAQAVAHGAYTAPGAEHNMPLETGAIAIPVMPSLPAPAATHDGLRRDISTEPCRVTGKPFGPLYFANSVEVEAEMQPELDRLSILAQSCPGMRIEVHGFSDRTGSGFTNRAMAQARAQAIADYLIATGLAPNRVAAIGRGTAGAVLPYSKGIVHADSRRVEFVIKDPAMDAIARRVMWELADLLDPTYIPSVAGLSLSP
ncbi:MAG TPA: OmpA family protein [Hyphomicrobium sp.]|nr:OmpA family protein [Hyphomicrobium sp.]